MLMARHSPWHFCFSTKNGLKRVYIQAQMAEIGLGFSLGLKILRALPSFPVFRHRCGRPACRLS